MEAIGLAGWWHAGFGGRCGLRRSAMESVLFGTLLRHDIVVCAFWFKEAFERLLSGCRRSWSLCSYRFRALD